MMNEAKSRSNHFPGSSFIIRYSSFLIFALTFVTFARLIPCEFTWWDDEDTVSQNARLNPPTWSTLGYYWTTAGEHETMGLYVPVTYTCWSVLAFLAHRDHPDSQGLMLNAWVFHGANVVLHAATAVVVYHLLRRLFEKPIPAFVGAMLFAVHPVQVEPVGWVSGTKDLLCGLFSALSLLMYVRCLQLTPHPANCSCDACVASDPSHETTRASQLRSTRHPRWRSRWRYLAGLLLFVLAMLAKPTGVVVPLMAAVIGIFLLGRPVRRTVVGLIPWFALMIPCLIWTQKVQPASWASPLPVWARPAVAADAMAFYFYKLLWPIHLGIDYGHNPAAVAANHEIYFAWILPAAAAGVLWWRWDRHRPAVAAALLFVLPLGPVLGFVPFEFQLISTTSDHYLYLPMLGVAVLAVWAISKFRIPFAVSVVVLIALGIRSVLQEPVWQDTRTLFKHALSINPISIPSLDGLGFVTGRDARQLSDAGHAQQARRLFDESIDWYRKSLEYDVNSVPSMLNLALDYKMIGRTDLGLAQIHRMVAVQPRLPDGLKADPISLAHLLIDFGDLPGAITWLEEVLRRDPRNITAALLRQRAIEHLNAATTNSAT